MTRVADDRASHDAPDAGVAPWTRIHARLEARLRAVEAELRAYPKPIPACDAQYEHLLEQRRAIPRDMERARALAREVPPAESPAAVGRFLAECAWLDSAAETGGAGAATPRGR